MKKNKRQYFWMGLGLIVLLSFILHSWGASDSSSNAVLLPQKPIDDISKKSPDTPISNECDSKTVSPFASTSQCKTPNTEHHINSSPNNDVKLATQIIEEIENKPNNINRDYERLLVSCILNTNELSERACEIIKRNRGLWQSSLRRAVRNGSDEASKLLATDLHRMILEKN